MQGIKEVVAEGFGCGGDIGDAEEIIQAGAKTGAGGSLRKIQVAEQIAKGFACGAGKIRKLVLPYGHACAF